MEPGTWNPNIPLFNGISEAGEHGKKIHESFAVYPHHSALCLHQNSCNTCESSPYSLYNRSHVPCGTFDP
jgi:hypothetical protein